MEHERAQDLFSDHLDATLAPALRRELEAHLSACAACRTLREVFGEVVEALRNARSLTTPSGLAERAATAALGAGAAPKPGSAMPVWLQFAAGLAALAVTALLLATLGATDRTSRLGRVKAWTTDTGSTVADRAERFVEGLRAVRVFMGAAFESRVDRVKDRADDYKELLQQKKKASPEPSPVGPSPSPAPNPSPQPRKINDLEEDRNLPNLASRQHVSPCVGPVGLGVKEA